MTASPGSSRSSGPPPSGATDHATLSSVASSLDELTDRVTAVAESHVGRETEDVARDLFEVERSLRAAHRRLAEVVRALRI